MAKNPRLIDMTGLRFGLWSVQEKAGNSPRGGALWTCRCDCGRSGVVAGSDLRGGKSTNCGCANLNRLGDLRRTHGSTTTRLYGIWQNMRARCRNPRNPGYVHYGARGISIYPEWEEFSAFSEWAEAAGYADNLSIERVDNDRGYSPENCIWADAKTQARNRSIVRRAPDGRSWAEIAEVNGVSARVLTNRINAGGWPPELAATWPVGKRLNPNATNALGQFVKREAHLWRR
ncbi:hypothetical protein [Phenylobacterium sp. SCN 70-31]|uniref:hypothetical protein n=1 Tax=Phenylobacterium sp. SCN 70-31 TaxID=1660129 RepID=UPI0025E05D12|nr:hypothetical protein [Phenylobacterium sp. SCN 70-31]